MHLVSLAVTALLLPSPAWAQAGAIAFEGEVAVVSDYRFRGLSLSGEKPALQGGVTATHRSGIYSYVWASTIEDYAGATVEADYAIGWSGALAGFDVDVSAQGFTYPGARDVAYWEAPVTVSRQSGPLRWTLGAAYAPPQTALADEANAYGFGALSKEIGKTTVEVRAGYEDGALAPDGKRDWSLTASRALERFTAVIGYADSDAAGSAVVASLSASF